MMYYGEPDVSETLENMDALWDGSNVDVVALLNRIGLEMQSEAKDKDYPPNQDIYLFKQKYMQKINALSAGADFRSVDHLA